MRYQLVLILALTLVSVTYARGGRKGVSGRLHKQEARIRAGEKSGKLSAEEAANLRKEGQDIRNERREMREQNNGKLTKEQRKELQKDLNARSEEIKAEKTDRVPSSEQQ